MGERMPVMNGWADRSPSTSGVSSGSMGGENGGSGEKGAGHSTRGFKKARHQAASKMQVFTTMCASSASDQLTGRYPWL